MAGSDWGTYNAPLLPENQVARNEYRKLGVESPSNMLQELLDKGQSQHMLAHKLGMSQATLSRLLSGHHKGLSYLRGKRLERMWLTPVARRKS